MREKKTTKKQSQAANRKKKQSILLLTKAAKYLTMCDKYSSMPNEEIISVCKNTKYTEGSANELTKTIIAMVEALGGYNKSLGIYTKSTTKKGVSDITGVLNGYSINIEVKYGKDTQSDAQKNVQAGIQQAGGKYFIAKDIVSTYEWLCKECNISPEMIHNLTNVGEQIFTKKKAA